VEPRAGRSRAGQGRTLTGLESLLEIPVVGAPLAGGPSTPALAAAVSEAGGLGFLAAGYKTAAGVATDIEAVRRATGRPFGVNVFVPGPATVDKQAVERYAKRLAVEEERYGVAGGEPRWSDDDWDAKLALLVRERPAVVSFTFGCPAADVVTALRNRSIAVWCTVTSPAEARIAAAAGVAALVVQGAEAGGHQGSFDDTDAEPLGLLELLAEVRVATQLPLVAAGGIADGRGIAAALAAGASAAQIGSALLLTPEAGTSGLHRAALAGGAPTALTRAFTGRRARGIVNRFMRDHGEAAPRAYPQIHFVTAPLRAAARAAGDPGGLNLWAGTSYRLAQPSPASELVRRLADESRAALRSR
jgi:nitronate monooxygenase